MNKRALRPIKRVMLMFPPMHDAILFAETMACPPLGIAYLAAAIRETAEVSLLDCVAEGYRRRKPISPKIMRVGISYDDIIERIRAYAPDMVGISCIFSNQIVCVRDIARRIKEEIDPDIVVATGGTHPSFLPERTLSETRVDYVVLGEGEQTLVDLLRIHNKGGEISSIDGIAYRDNGEIRVNPKKRWIDDLDSLPFPARDLLPMEKYFKIRQPMGLRWQKARNTPIISSRGCPYKCSFCSSYRHWGSRFRKRSPENVLAEIEHLKERYEIQELKWQDDNLTADRNRAKAIFQGMIDRGLSMPWNTPNGIALWTLDDELMALMKRSGCYQITLAVESGDPQSFEKYVGKPFTFSRVREVVRMARRHGISTVAYFISGFPDETLSQVKNSMRFGLSLGVDYLVPFVYNPLPGSDLWAECIEKGYIPEDYRYEEANNYYIPGAVIQSKTFNVNDVNFVQGVAYLVNLLRFPFRNPVEFLNYYTRKFLVTPWFAVDFFRVIWRHKDILVRGLKERVLLNREKPDA